MVIISLQKMKIFINPGRILIEDYDSGIYTIIMQFPDTIVTRKIIKTNQ